MCALFSPQAAPAMSSDDSKTGMLNLALIGGSIVEQALA
jgi:hypothetical protein